MAGRWQLSTVAPLVVEGCSSGLRRPVAELALPARLAAVVDRLVVTRQIEPQLRAVGGELNLAS